MKLFKWGSRQEPVTDYPYSLNKEKVGALEDLSTDRKYVIFMTLLRDIAEDKGLNLLRSPEESNFRYWQGYVNCLREVQTLIPDLVEQARNTQRNKDVRTHAEPGTDKRTFFGSAWWDSVYGPTAANRKPDA
jgi:hypothetical protein